MGSRRPSNPARSRHEGEDIREIHDLIQSQEEAFWNNVVAFNDHECWAWVGPVADKNAPSSYGRTWIGHPRGVYAHRVSYQLTVRPIPDGMVIDHLCRNTLCVNPDHLDPVTPSVNTKRGNAPTVVLARSGKCKRGHELDKRYVHPRTGKVQRSCKMCSAANKLKWQQKHRDKKVDT